MVDNLQFGLLIKSHLVHAINKLRKWNKIRSRAFWIFECLFGIGFSWNQNREREKPISRWWWKNFQKFHYTQYDCNLVLGQAYTRSPSNYSQHVFRLHICVYMCTPIPLRHYNRVLILIIRIRIACGRLFNLNKSSLLYSNRCECVYILCTYKYTQYVNELNSNI